MIYAILATIVGLALLLWSADWFIEGAAVTARHIGVPPLLIGIVVVGLGTSSPEMVVSAFSAHQGNPGLALGNAYGSNIANIALILGLTALIAPVSIHSRVLRKELPILCGVTVFAAFQLFNGMISRVEAVVLLLVLGGIIGWSIYEGLRKGRDSLSKDVTDEFKVHAMPLKKALLFLVVGLVVLVASSRVLVWGAIELAAGLGISDMVIGLTIVAFGTSLPELAASFSALRKKEHDLIVGNVLGSNLFNTTGVVGIASVIHPIDIDPEVISRDLLVMGALTLSLLFFTYGFRGAARVNRIEGGLLLLVYLGYIGWLAAGVVGAKP